MTCFCGKTALYSTGHCKDHREESVVAMKALGSKKTGNGSQFISSRFNSFVEPCYAGGYAGPIQRRGGERER